jgi:hypothetical protein
MKFLTYLSFGRQWFNQNWQFHGWWDWGKQLKIILWMFKRNYPSSRHWYFYWCPSCFRQSTKTAFKIPLCWCDRRCFLRSFSGENWWRIPWKFKRLCYCFLESLSENTHFKWKTVMLMPYMIQNWLLSYQTIEGINNILTQMDAPKNKSKMRLEELRSYTLNLRRTLQISLTIWERMRNKINRRINFLTIRKMKFCMVD